MKLVNLTAGKITIWGIRNQVLLELLASSQPAVAERVWSKGTLTIDETELVIGGASFGEVTNLPEVVEGTFYVVTMDVAMACPKRSDLLVPQPLVFDGVGLLKGYGGLSRLNRYVNNLFAYSTFRTQIIDPPDF